MGNAKAKETAKGFAKKDKEALQELAGALNIGITSSALFDRNKTDDSLPNKPYMPGPALDLMNGLEKINQMVGSNIFRFKILSTNNAETGLKVLESCDHYDIPITCGAVFGNGPLKVEFLKAHEINWFITTNHADAQRAHDLGIASCSIDPNIIPPQNKGLSAVFNQHASVHFVLDLDRVVFDDEADEFFVKEGPEKYFHNERAKAAEIMNDGPFIHLPQILSQIITKVPALGEHIKISALTARGDWATLRAFKSLQDKGLKFNGGLYFSGRTLIENGKFLNNGLDKGEILKIICDDANTAHIFLDDSDRNINSAKSIVLSGLVPKNDPHGKAINDDIPAHMTPTAKKKAPAPK